MAEWSCKKPKMTKLKQACSLLGTSFKYTRLTKFSVAYLMYSFDNDELPNHLDNYFSEIASVHKYQTRLASENLKSLSPYSFGIQYKNVLLSWQNFCCFSFHILASFLHGFSPTLWNLNGRTHQLAKPDVFDVFIFSLACNSFLWCYFSSYCICVIQGQWKL